MYGFIEMKRQFKLGLAFACVEAFMLGLSVRAEPINFEAALLEGVHYALNYWCDVFGVVHGFILTGGVV